MKLGILGKSRKKKKKNKKNKNKFFLFYNPPPSDFHGLVLSVFRLQRACLLYFGCDQTIKATWHRG